MEKEYIMDDDSYTDIQTPDDDWLDVISSLDEVAAFNKDNSEPIQHNSYRIKYGNRVIERSPSYCKIISDDGMIRIVLPPLFFESEGRTFCNAQYTFDELKDIVKKEYLKEYIDAVWKPDDKFIISSKTDKYVYVFQDTGPFKYYKYSNILQDNK